MAEDAREQIAEAVGDRHERDPVSPGEQRGRALGRVAPNAEDHGEIRVSTLRPADERRESAEGLDRHEGAASAQEPREPARDALGSSVAGSRCHHDADRSPSRGHVQPESKRRAVRSARSIRTLLNTAADYREEMTR